MNTEIEKTVEEGRMLFSLHRRVIQTWIIQTANFWVQLVLCYVGIAIQRIQYIWINQINSIFVKIVAPSRAIICGA